MSEHIILVEKPKDWPAHFPSATVVAAEDYLAQAEFLKRKRVKVINLCRGYRYLDVGYYCSLLAEARRHKVIPTVRTLTDLGQKDIYSLDAGALDALVQKSLAKDNTPDQVELQIFFGRSSHEGFQELARQIFDLFRCPLLKVEFRRNGRWHINAIKPMYLHQLSNEQQAFFLDALSAYTSRRWQLPRAKTAARYDLAVLHDPAEKLAPSNPRALQKFVKVGKKMGINVELIGKKDYARLAEYDALFIRETTNVNHHTYRFAKKADNEGMVVMDDPDSILKCTNKVYLAELLAASKVPAPKTLILNRQNVRSVGSHIGFPVVLKIPDGSFSRGVYKVDDPKALEDTLGGLFKSSQLILAQEFMYTEFDWRIGVLDRQPLYACQYFMSKRHWQIVKHSASGKAVQGGFRTLPLAEVPPEVLQTAVAAANLIGDGLYGVDLKQTERGVFVIEVNDNPNLDAGIEDAVLGEELYRRVLESFVQRVEARREAGQSPRTILPAAAG